MIKAYFISLISMLIIDAPWIKFVAQPMLNKYVKPLFADNPNLLAAGIFYLIYPAAVYYLAVHGATDIKEVAIRGAVVGFLAYATYDLTNLATLKNWPWQVAVADIIWGAVLTSIVAVIAFKFA